MNRPQRGNFFIVWAIVCIIGLTMLVVFWPKIARPAEPVLPQVETWPVVSEIDDLDGLLLMRAHQDPNDANKLGITMWFKNKNNELEVFIRINGLVKSQKGIDGSQSLASIKLENGIWTEPVNGEKAAMGIGILNGERAVIFRTLDDNGDTKQLRAFLLKDLVPIKPKN